MEMQLTSADFAPGSVLPPEATCDGAGRPPDLSWTGVPEGTAELVLICEDPDAPGGTFVHWVLWGLDPTPGAVPVDPAASGATSGRNSYGDDGYGPPCPPPSHGPHRYRFQLYALSQRLPVQSGAGVEEVRAAMERRVLAEASLTGVYERAA